MKSRSKREGDSGRHLELLFEAKIADIPQDRQLVSRTSRYQWYLDYPREDLLLPQATRRNNPSFRHPRLGAEGFVLEFWLKEQN